MATTPLSPTPAFSTITKDTPASTAPPTVRTAVPEDATDISILGTRVFRASFADSGPTPEQMTDYLSTSYSPSAMAADIAHPDRTTFVSYSSTGELQGFAMLLRNSTESEPCVAHVQRAAEVQRLYVDESWHGRGVAGALIRELEKVARAEGFIHLWLGVWESNFRAQTFYTRLGYKKVGEHGFDVGGDVATDWIMIKDL